MWKSMSLINFVIELLLGYLLEYKLKIQFFPLAGLKKMIYLSGVLRFR